MVAATTGSFVTGGGFEDFGEIMLRSERAAGYVRVDWFTPDGLPTWGDGRLTILGTEGTIEVRKYIDLEGRAGTDHLFVADNKGTRRLHCEGEPLNLLPQLRARRAAAHRDGDVAGTLLYGVPAGARGAGKSETDRAMSRCGLAMGSG